MPLRQALAYRLGGFLKTHQSAALIFAAISSPMRRPSLDLNVASLRVRYLGSALFDRAASCAEQSSRLVFWRAVSRWNIGELAP
jgi:hypothetical protein